MVEIGSDQGANTRKLLELSETWNGVVHVVDPDPKYEVQEWQALYGPRLKFHRDLSLHALRRIPLADAYLIDGDHNWYTVYHELRLIRASAIRRKASAFPLVLLHDTGWPYGRRDLYYDPQTIPSAFRNPFKKAGMDPHREELVGSEGLNAHLNNAVRENGRRNGVLTAVEDFLKDARTSVSMFSAPAFHGLTVLISKAKLEASPDIAAFLNEFQGSKLALQLLQDLESARIEAEIARQSERRRRERDVAAVEELAKRRGGQLEDALRHVERVNRRADNAEQFIERVQESRQTQEALLKLKDDALVRAEQTIHATRTRLQQADDERTALKSEIARLTRQLESSHKAQRAEQAIAISDAEGRIQKLERRLADAQLEAQELRMANAAISQDLHRLRETHASTLALRGGDLARQEQAIRAASDKLRLTQHMANELHEGMEVLNGELALQAAELVALSDRVGQLESELTFTRKQLDAALEAKAEATGLRAQLTLMEFRMAASARAGEVASATLLGRLLPQRARRRMVARLARRVRQTRLFSEDWYLQQNPDVARAGIDAAEHFVEHGVFEGRNPGPQFSTIHYLMRNPDVVAAGVNPLLHFVEHGSVEGRDPLPDADELVDAA
jgi:hypothetical protein